MKTTTKTGHKENVKNLNVLSARTGTFGDAYNPSNPALTVANMIIIGKNGQDANDAVDIAEVAVKNMTRARSESFNALDSVVDRSLNAMKVSGASEQTIEQAKSLAREVHGRRASELLSDEELAAAKAKGNEITQHVVHNASFDRKIENFGRYALFFASVPEYKPNETEITAVGLNGMLTELKAKNAGLLAAETTYATALSHRDTVLYADTTGLVDIAQSVKTYVKSVFGSRSGQYKQISDLVFTRII